MANIITETVTHVHHWNDTLFSFRTTRAPSLRFENGHFLMVGLMVDGKPLMRAYSVASANYQEELEFFSIKVADGPLTSRLQNIQPGDEVLLSTKATGTLVADHLLPGKRLYLLSTGTGLAPFLSIIRDPTVYEQFEQIILVHGVRVKSELAYEKLITEELPQDEFLGELVQRKLIYYPTVTREDYEHTGRLTDLMTSGQLFDDLRLPMPTVADDRFMICGGPGMLKDTCLILNEWGFHESRHGHKGEYVIERAFVEQ
ncbi:ferredoxin--NADP reductase [Halioxenophilus sp. WMMB6]|uniref:ferredoxin--NADP reductase n=1 Tax=Halioxenophilus sp. WMMB6 TaxID=3073815 RepID=UPI00295F1458|nr:ferredoxin--NADP reductase [Halioxenophilus sp. WMMB6]